MKVLFIASDFSYNSKEKQVVNKSKYLEIVKSQSMNSGNAYFIQALLSIGKLDIAFGLSNASTLINNDYDLIVLDIKLFLSKFVFKDHIKLLNKHDSKKILFIGMDGNFTKLFDIKKLLNLINIDSIYCSNLLSDKRKYFLPNDILQILHPTYIGLGYLNIKFDHNKKIFIDLPNLTDDFIYDLFFAGAVSDSFKIRKKVISDIKRNNFLNNCNIYIKTFNPGAQNRPLTPAEYFEKLGQSKLCLDPCGQHDTHSTRSLELLLLGRLPIVDYGFKNFYLSTHFSSYLKYFSFDDMEQLINLVKKYQNTNLMKEIALELKDIMLTFYNPATQGEIILKNLKI